jgi:hypothetical protein
MHLYRDGEWSTTSTILDTAKTEQELYQRLTTLGFQQCQEVSYRGGTVRLYMRDSLFGKRQHPIAFEFCGLLYLGTALFPVALKSFQDVLQFLREIDAHPKTSSVVTVSNLDLFEQRLSLSLAEIAERLEDPAVTIRNLAGLKNAIDHCTEAITAMEQRLQHGLVMDHSLQTPEEQGIHQGSTPNGMSSPIPLNEEEL